jgi:hypothetical protein
MKDESGMPGSDSSFILHPSSFILGGNMARSTHGKVTSTPAKKTEHPPVSKTPNRDGGQSPTQPPPEQAPEAPEALETPPPARIGWWWVPIAVWVLCLLFLFGIDLVGLIYRAVTVSPP